MRASSVAAAFSLLLAPASAFRCAAPAPALARAAAPAPRRAAVAAADAAAAAEIVTFTPNALKQLDEMRSKQGLDELCLRVGVRAGGCSGMSYVMDLMKPEEEAEGDTIVEFAPKMRCFVDPKSLMFLYGLQLDYSDELIGGGFGFSNPNAESECGCGKSFGV